MFKIARASLTAHKLRLVSTSLSVLLGVAFLAGTLVFTDTIRRTFDDLFADVNAGTDAFVRSSDSVEAFGLVQRERIDDSLLTEVSATEGVARAAGVVAGTARIVGSDGTPLGVAGNGPPNLGLSWSGDSELSPWVPAEGRGPSAPDEVAIDRASALAGDLHIGDEVTILSSSEPETFELVGIMRFGSADSPGGATASMFDLATAQRLLAQPGQLDAITVAAVDGVDQQQLVERLQTTLEGRGDVEVLTGAEITAEDQNAIRDGLRFFDAFLLAFALVGLVVAGFIVYNTFAILVAQRTRETALLRAIGAGRGQVIGTVVLEAVVVGLLASAAGIVAGVLTAGGLRAMLEALGVDLPADGLVLSSRTIVVSMIAGLGLTAVSAVGPALRASRVAPLAALREISVDRSDRSKLRTIAGVVALVVGAAGVIAGLAQPAPAPAGLGALAIFVGVFVLGPVIAPPVISVLGVPVRALRGTTGSMAVRNALRNPKRTANTATALTVGLALVCAITVLGASLRASIRDTIDGQFTGDFAIESGSFGIGGLSPDLARDIAAVDGVAATSGIRFAVGEINGGADGFSVVDPATAFELFDVGVIAGRGEDLDEHGILVFEDKAADLGVGVGDQVTVHLAGLDPRPLTVVGIYRENSLAGNYAISQSLAAATGHPQFDSSVFVRLDPGATIAEVRPVLAELVAAYPDADLQDRDEYRESQAAQIDQFVNLVYGLLGLAIVIASLGVANTLRLSVLERTRELGLLRAVGMTRAQSRSMVRWEAVLTAVLGAVQGVVIGVFFGWVLIRALRDQGLESFSVPVPSLVVIVAIAAALGVAASIRPARRAARLDVLGAIADH